MPWSAIAIAISLLGLSLSWSALAASFATPIESPELLIALLVAVFVAFPAAIISHPSRKIETGSTTTFSVEWRDIIKTAPRWSTAIMALGALALVATIATQSNLGSNGDSTFEITREQLAGRPDRVRYGLAFFCFAYGVSLSTALSGRALRAKMLV